MLPSKHTSFRIFYVSPYKSRSYLNQLNQTSPFHPSVPVRPLLHQPSHGAGLRAGEDRVHQRVLPDRGRRKCRHEPVRGGPAVPESPGRGVHEGGPALHPGHLEQALRTVRLRLGAEPGAVRKQGSTGVSAGSDHRAGQLSLRAGGQDRGRDRRGVGCGQADQQCAGADAGVRPAAALGLYLWRCGAPAGVQRGHQVDHGVMPLVGCHIVDVVQCKVV